ncbi:PIG-L family deacetylase [soil metagenome]
MNLLAMFAHPDDEAFSCGGTLAKAAAAGHTVSLVCTTRGEEGEIVHPDIDPDPYPKGDARGKLREEELTATCRALGINPPIFLDYHDSGFPTTVGEKNPRSFMNASLETVERQLLDHIARLKPDVMITFDPHGGYPHIDHITIHRAAIAAFWSAGSVMQPAPKRLFFPARSSEEVAAAKAGSTSTTVQNVHPELHGVSPDSFAAVIDVSAFVNQKKAAMFAHRSQFGPEERVEKMLDSRPQMLQEEAFVLGGLRGSFPEMPVTDLFTGLEA